MAIDLDNKKLERMLTRGLGAGVFFALASCGGGGGGGSSTPLSIDPMESASAMERAEFSFAPVVNGSPNSYQWVQTSGTTVKEAELSGRELSFVVPELSSDETLTFQVTASTSGGEEVSASLSINISAYESIETLVFEGEGLLNCLRSQVQNDVAMTELICDGIAIGSLDDLSQLKSLQAVTLTNASLTGLSGLDELTKLAYIDVSSNNIRSVGDVFEKLTQLEHVNISDFDSYYYSDINFDWVENNPSLKYLNISSTSASDYSGLSKAASLEELVANDAGSNFKSLSFLLGLENLTSLSIEGYSGITDISALKDNTVLKSLSFKNNSNVVVDAEILSTLTNLESLDLSARYYNSSEGLDLEPLLELTQLQYLSLNRRGGVAGTESLAKLVNLKELYLENVDLTSVSFLTELNSLEVLDLSSNSRLSDIADLAEVSGLVELDLSNNRNLSDLSALSSLSSLESLRMSSIYYNGIDISFLSELEQLEILDLSGNRIDDLSALLSAVNLVELNLSQTGSSSLPSFSEMSKLQVLDVSEKYQIESFSDLGSLSQLKELYISRTYTEDMDISDWSGLVSLEYLDFSDAYRDVQSSSAFKAMVNLEYLDLERTGIMEVDAFDQLVNLSYLNLAYSEISSVSPLYALTGLGTLNLWGNDLVPCSEYGTLDESLVDTTIQRSSDCMVQPVADLEFADDNFKQCVLDADPDADDIQSLSCSRDDISDVSGIDQLENLRSFYLSYNDTEADLTGLGTAESVTSVIINRSVLDDLGGINAMVGLKTLEITYTDLADVQGLEKLTALTRLRLESNKLSSIDNLSALTNLTSLSVTNNNLASIGVINSMPSLRGADFSNNNISTLSSVKDNDSSVLYSLDLSGNTFTDVSELSGMTGLRGLDIYNMNTVSCSSIAELESTNSSLYIYGKNNCI